MIRFFKTTQPAALFAIPLIVILLWAHKVFSFTVPADTFQMPLWSLVRSFFSVFPSWLNLLIFCALISWQAIYFNLLINKHEVLYKNSYLPALFFVLFVSSMPSFQQIHPLHLVNLIVLRIFDKLFSLHQNSKTISTIFDCGFLAGVAALLYMPALPILILLMFALAMMRPFSIREWLVLLISYSIPFMFLSVIKFWNHELISFWESFFARLSTRAPFFEIPKSSGVQFLGAVLLLILVLSLLRLRRNYYKNIIRVRVYQQLQLLFFVLGFCSVFLSKEIDLVHLLIFTIPVSLWYSYYFVSQKKKLWMGEGLLWLLVGSILYCQFFDKV